MKIVDYICGPLWLFTQRSDVSFNKTFALMKKKAHYPFISAPVSQFPFEILLVFLFSHSDMKLSWENRWKYWVLLYIVNYAGRE